MEEKVFECELGKIHYWTRTIDKNYLYTLVFLPGIGVDHTIYNEQIEFFRNKFNIITWDEPLVGKSDKFDSSFSLFDLARFLKNILDIEGVNKPIIIGHSVGGYIGQAYYKLFPENIMGMVIMDAGPLKNGYLSSWETNIFKHTDTILKYIPWLLLKMIAPFWVSSTKHGRKRIREVFDYNDSKRNEHRKMVGYYHSILVEATEMVDNLSVDCPLLMICGDSATDSCIRQAMDFRKNNHFKLELIRNAGHFSIIDNPRKVCLSIYKACASLKYFHVSSMQEALFEEVDF